MKYNYFSVTLIVISVFVFASSCKVYSSGELRTDSVKASPKNERSKEEVVSVNQFWTPAEFMTITVGVDKREKALAVLGRPIESGSAQDEEGVGDSNSEIVDTFKNIDSMYSHVNVYSSEKNWTVVLIEAAVPSLPVEVLFQRFGEGFERKTYSLVRCRANGAPKLVLVEKPDGDIVRWENPKLGVVLLTQEAGRIVHSVEYRSTRLPSETQDCLSVSEK